MLRSTTGGESRVKKTNKPFRQGVCIKWQEPEEWVLKQIKKEEYTFFVRVFMFLKYRFLFPIGWCRQASVNTICTTAYSGRVKRKARIHQKISPSKLERAGLSLHSPLSLHPSHNHPLPLLTQVLGLGWWRIRMDVQQLSWVSEGDIWRKMLMCC